MHATISCGFLRRGVFHWIGGEGLHVAQWAEPCGEQNIFGEACFCAKGGRPHPRRSRTHSQARPYGHLQPRQRSPRRGRRVDRQLFALSRSVQDHRRAPPPVGSTVVERPRERGRRWMPAGKKTGGRIQSGGEERSLTCSLVPSCQQRSLCSVVSFTSRDPTSVGVGGGVLAILIVSRHSQRCSFSRLPRVQRRRPKLVAPAETFMGKHPRVHLGDLRDVTPTRHRAGERLFQAARHQPCLTHKSRPAPQ
ncbi:hypothetical protein BHE74_00023536 [Ensete ventricosum]|nr:hypothetical protein BHE74_00023536 [Ensete ventricosum]